VKTFTLTCIGLLFISSAYAQYHGGSGQGTRVLSMPSLSLSAATMFAGGANDGHSIISVNGVSMTTGSQYSGGGNDGTSTLTSLATSLSAASPYSGGAGDGLASLGSNTLALAVSSMYNGGSNDGFHLTNTLAVGLSGGSNYSGGPDDGLASVQHNLTNLGTSNMYAGGSNDGISGLLSAATNMGQITGMYAGGQNDGFTSLLAPATSIIPLPITWEAFNVTRKGVDALLYWQVGHEQFNLGYELERSYDAIDFRKLGYVEAVSSISTANQYRYVDPDPSQFCKASLCVAVFYRLRLLYKDGTHSFSPIRRLSIDAASMQASVFPNPASDVLIIQLNNTGGLSPDYSLVLYNSIGAVVYARNVASAPRHEIRVHDYPSGVYHLRLTIDGHTYPYQIAITH
jgi:hypothetical protein